MNNDSRYGRAAQLGALLAGVLWAAAALAQAVAVDEAAEFEDEAIAIGIDPQPQFAEADNFWQLAQQAEAAPAPLAAALLLQAIDGAWSGRQIDDAQAFIERLASKPMTDPQLHALKLNRARLAQAQGQHARALGLLRLLDYTLHLNPQARAERWRLVADSQQALGNESAVAAALLRRDKWLTNLDRIAGQRRLFAILKFLDPSGVQLLREGLSEADRASGLDDDLNGWLALGETLHRALPADRVASIARWRRLHPQHPASGQLLNQPLLARPPPRIALLLPLTSPFAESAQAFHAGFMAAHGQARQPNVSVHDIGADPTQVALHYRAAVAGGADFVVGPLGRRAVNALLAAATPTVPTLMIGEIPPSRAAPDLYGISLSPEQDARQVAEHAFAEGRRQVGVLRSDLPWGRRVANAFVAHWEALGGVVVDNASFAAGVADYSSALRQFLRLDKSIGRERLLSAQLGLNLQFTPRRRDDMDFLFLATDAAQARLLAPQLRFFQAHDVPLYATSAVYSGHPNPATDADLDGIIFGDMGWMLDAARRQTPPATRPKRDKAAAVTYAVAPDLVLPSPPPPEPMDLADLIESAAADGAAAADSAENHARSPYQNTDLERLYALGLESYQLIPALAALRRDRSARYFGDAVDLSVQGDGNVVRRFAWARFVDGLPVALPARADSRQNAAPEVLQNAPSNAPHRPAQGSHPPAPLIR